MAKSGTSLASLALVALGWFVALNASATPPPGYYLVWSDEFAGTSLDPTKWFYFNQVSQNAVDTIDAISVTNGNLTINTYTTNGVNYTGIISSAGLFNSFYGYYESSIEFSDSNATWSAFWLQTPTGGEHIGDPSALGAEVDICEHRYVDVSNTNIVSDSVQETLHWDGYGAQEQTINPGQVGSGLSSGFHTYSVLWTPTDYEFGIDGITNLVTTAGHSDRSEVIMFSSQVQSPSWAGISPAGGYEPLGMSSTKMVVDYVRYYAPSSMVFWTGAASSDWNDSNNWFSNMTATATNDVIFNHLSVGNFDIPLTQDTTVHTLTIQDTPPMYIHGNALTVTSGIDLVSALNNSTIGSPLILSADQTWKVGTGIQLTISGMMSGPGNLTISGWGTVAITGTNLCSGSTTINNGALIIAGTISNSVFVTGGTLSGTGTFAGPVQVSGGTVLANLGIPLLISNSLTVLSGGSATFAVDASAGTNGEIVGLSSVIYGGTLVLNDVTGPFSAGQAFKLFDATNYSGSFASFSPLIPGYELAWDTNTLTIDGTLRVMNTVPVETTNVVESRSGNSTTGANNPAFSFQGFSSTISSAKSTAPGCTSASCRFTGTFTPSPAFSVTPTLLVGPTYSVAVTWGKIAGNFPESSNFVVAATIAGVSSTTIPSTTAAFSGGVSNNINNQWVTVGTITPNTANPKLTFTYVSGWTAGRWYVDSVQFISVLPRPGSISIGIQDTNLVMNWTGNFTLQSSTNVAGPYIDVPGPVVVGPYTNLMTYEQIFFRLRQ